MTSFVDYMRPEESILEQRRLTHTAKENKSGPCVPQFPTASSEGAAASLSFFLELLIFFSIGRFHFTSDGFYNIIPERKEIPIR